MQKIIFLSGFMGSGKTSVGIELARLLNWPVIDTDKRIQHETGQSITEIFKKYGEAHFRALETKLLAKLCNQAHQVVTLGGGIPLLATNRDFLKKGFWIFLKTSPACIENRLAGDTSRPLLSGVDTADKIRSLLNQRNPFYNQAPHTILTDHLTQKTVAKKIAHLWRTFK